MVVRRALTAEVEVLSELALRSKAHWGYDETFIEACREELTVRPQDVEGRQLTVAVQAGTGRILGFYGLLGTGPDEAELSALFVEPAVIGTGIGRLLFDDAVGVAHEAAVRRIRIEADPFAAAFYEHMGATPSGTTPSHSMAGRELPLYVVDIPASNPPTGSGNPTR
ncbi:MAG TPA: GNAT family N-acetyltransferase [Acidimicrobiales bacterium]